MGHEYDWVHKKMLNGDKKRHLRFVNDEQQFAKNSPIFSEKQLDDYVGAMSQSRQLITKHFVETLGIPVEPSVEILMALKVATKQKVSLKKIASNICRNNSVAERYLKLLSSNGLIDFDGKEATLTTKGLDALKFATGQTYSIFVQLLK
ncbi:MAG: hypothetical protein ABJN65_18110 [Parasphingorhabdus sp.]